MTKTLAISFILISLLLTGGIFVTAQQQEAHTATFISKDSLRLSLYDSGLAIVQDVRTFELEEGLNRIPFTGISSQANFSSLTLASSEMRVVSQSYSPPEPLDIPTLLNKNIGQTISVTRTDEAATQYEGILLDSDGSNILLQLADGTLVTLYTGEIREYHFSVLPQDRITQPTLFLLVNSDTAGTQQVSLTYLISGLGWHVDYNLLLEESSVNLTGWLNISNFSGAALENAEVTLLAGSFERLDFVSRDTGILAAATATALPSPSPSGTPSPYDYGTTSTAQPVNFRYVLPQPITLENNETQTIEFLAGAEAESNNIYIYDASPRIYGYSGFITSPEYGITGVTQVQNFLAFSTGTDLPAGSLTLYEDEESLTLLGQTQLPFTPADQPFQIYLENSGEVTGERRQVEFITLSNDAVQETYEIRLRNQSSEAIEVIVPERMSRSSNWEILAATVPFEQPDSFGVEFTVEVPAGGETVITYTVLYTRPQ